jgi:CheY-like chemotaxis protein
MGGEIGLDSEQGAGTTIKFSCTFELDKIPVESSKNGTQAADSAKVDASRSLEGYRVLLVEDNDVNVLVARSLMKKMGLKITLAENGQIAIDKIEAAHKDGLRPPFDIVLMDLQMPVLDGYEATKKLRAKEEYADLVIVAMTAHAINEEKEHCLAVGMNDHLTKPIEVSKLKTTLEHHLLDNKPQH